MRFLFSIGAVLFIYSVSGQGMVSLRDALQHYENELSVQFSYDTELLDLVSDEAKFTTTDINEFIVQVSEALPLAIQAVDEKYFTIRTVETTYTITVSDSEDGLALPPEMGVTVLVNGAPIKSTYSDNAWSFNYKPSANDEVQVFTPGFDPQIISVEELLNGKSFNKSMEISTVQLSTLTVEDYLTKGINIDPSKQSITVKVSDLPLLPGETDGDIFASIAALPGVTTPDGRAGNLFIRGSETDQTLILFDNIPIYHRGHYYGTISPYNPKVISNVEVYRSGFHPRLGDRVGGAIVINSGASNSDKHKIGVGANTLFGMGYAQTTSSNNKFGISIGARHSYPSSFQSPKLEAISESVFAATGLVNQDGELTSDLDVLFKDFNGKVTWKPNAKNQLSVSTIYTNSDVEYVVRPSDGESTPEENSFRNSGINADWFFDMNNQWQSKLSATYSVYTYDNLTEGISDLWSINQLKDGNIRQEFSNNRPKRSYQFGLDYKWQEVFIDYNGRLRRTGEPFAFKDNTHATSFSPFVNWEYFGWKKWFMQVGVRSTYYDRLNDFRVAPRLLVNYEMTDWMTLKGSTGLYNQYLSQVKNLEFSSGGFDNELWTLADNKRGNIIHGTQSMGGVLFHDKKWILDIEYFHKTANNITVYENRTFDNNSIYFTMDQLTYGIDVLLKRQLTDNASMWVGYSFNDSEIKLDTTDQVTYESKYVQPSVWYIGSSFYKNRWKLSGAYKYGSGLNAQSLDIIYAQVLRDRMIANLPPEAPPPTDDPFADLPERYPNVHMLDISASYRIPQTDQRKWSASFGLSLLNVLNQENLTDRVFRGQQGFLDRYAVGFAPNLMVIVEW